MVTKSLSELEENYNLEIDRIEKTIKKTKAKKILLQFPDGMKPYAAAVVSELERRTNNNLEFFIWLGTCFGACDTPRTDDFDLLVQFGHSPWK